MRVLSLTRSMMPFSSSKRPPTVLPWQDMFSTTAQDRSLQSTVSEFIYPFQRKSTLKPLEILWYSVSGDQSKWFLSVWFRVLKIWSVSKSSRDFGVSASMMHFHKSIIFYKMLFNNLPCANVAFLISKWDHEINSKTEHSTGLKSFFIGEVIWVTKWKVRLKYRWILQSTKWLSNHKYVMKRHKSLAYW